MDGRIVMVTTSDFASHPALPGRANLENLRTRAKARLVELRRGKPQPVLSKNLRR
jgi:hypothetical protein